MARRKDNEFAGWLAEGGRAWEYIGPLSDDVVTALPSPAAGNRIKYDSRIKGFGLRVTSAGARAFIPNYRNAQGRERRFTIGSSPDWSVAQARDQAAELKRRVDVGEDPMGVRHAERAEATIAELSDRFEAEHLPRKRAATAREYKALIRRHIRPTLGAKKVAAITFHDIERLHRKITEAGAPYVANRTLAITSKMFSLAIKWGWRSDNPTRGVERAPEVKRERYLTPAEIGRLSKALATHPERVSANAVRLLLLTGARKGETLASRWQDFDLAAGVWTKPSAHTKQKKYHRVPLSPPALALLAAMRSEAEQENTRRQRDGLPPIECVFPSVGGAPLGDVKHFWASVCRKAGISGVRVHDLRHTYASILASSGLSLPVIGALLGHTQAATTHRYAHLFDDPLRQATERAGAFITAATNGAKPAAEVVQHPAVVRAR
jgi:integrase